MTDVSNVPIEAILEEEFEFDLESIMFLSGKTNAINIRYLVCDRKVLGIVWDLGQWKQCFHGPHPIIIQTYHELLRHLPNQTSIKKRVLGWLEILQGYTADFNHILKRGTR